MDIHLHVHLDEKTAELLKTLLSGLVVSQSQPVQASVPTEPTTVVEEQAPADPPAQAAPESSVQPVGRKRPQRPGSDLAAKQSSIKRRLAALKDLKIDVPDELLLEPEDVKQADHVLNKLFEISN